MSPNELAELTDEYRLVESFDGSGRRSMLAVRAPSTPRALTPREAAVVEQVARGYSNKRVGAILGIAPGTVAAHLSAAAKKLGCRRRTELLAVACSVRTPKKELPSHLSTAERHVVELLGRGHPPSVIARERGVSPKTIANQLASVYRKLAVNTREELLAALSR